MLVQLARKPKTIAWTFFALFYVELLLTPIVAGAAVPFPMTYARSGNTRWNPVTNLAVPSMKKYTDAGHGKASQQIAKPILTAIAEKAAVAPSSPGYWRTRSA